MKNGLRTILLTVDHLDRVPGPALAKAAYLARATGARLELFHAIADLGSGPPARFMTREDFVNWKREVAANRLARLKRLARTKGLGRLAECTVAWDASPTRAIVRRARAVHADLVVAGTHGHTLGMRLRLGRGVIDWELIRQCPVPLLLVKSRRAYRGAAVIAAVDPFHANAKPAALDPALLRAAVRIGGICRGDVHVFHAYMPLVPVQTLPMAAAGPAIATPPDLEPMHQHQLQRALGRLAARVSIPAARRHLQLGGVAGELQALTRRLRAGMVVMGAVSRSAITRIIIGNTAEKVLDELPCDVLVIKPRGFKAKFAAPAHGSPRLGSTMARGRTAARRGASA